MSRVILVLALAAVAYAAQSEQEMLEGVLMSVQHKMETAEPDTLVGALIGKKYLEAWIDGDFIGRQDNVLIMETKLKIDEETHTTRPVLSVHAVRQDPVPGHPKWLRPGRFIGSFQYRGIKFVTDNDWKCVKDQPPADWTANGFDDSRWPAARQFSQNNKWSRYNKHVKDIFWRAYYIWTADTHWHDTEVWCRVYLPVPVGKAPANLVLSDQEVQYFVGEEQPDISVKSVENDPTSYRISPSLPAGLSIDSNTGTISGTTTHYLGETNFVVTASNAFGSTTTVLKLTVFGASPKDIEYNNGNVVTIFADDDSNAINVVPTYIGAKGKTLKWSYDGALPQGLHFDEDNGAISGKADASVAGTSHSKDLAVKAHVTDDDNSRDGEATFTYKIDKSRIPAWNGEAPAKITTFTYKSGSTVRKTNLPAYSPSYPTKLSFVVPSAGQTKFELSGVPDIVSVSWSSSSGVVVQCNAKDINAANAGDYVAKITASNQYGSSSFDLPLRLQTA